MSVSLILIILLLLVIFGGGGYYAHGAYGPYYGGGIGIVGIILIILVVWLVVGHVLARQCLSKMKMGFGRAVIDQSRPPLLSRSFARTRVSGRSEIARSPANMRHGVNKVVARIPITIYERSIHEDWDEGDWKRWLNSTEAAPFRIWGGRV